MPPIHHQKLGEEVKAVFCRDFDEDCFRLPLGVRFLLDRLLFLDITPLF